MEFVKQYDIIRYVQDEHGDVYMNINDLEKLFESKKEKMTQVFVEHITVKRFIDLLRKYETAINQLP